MHSVFSFQQISTEYTAGTAATAPTAAAAADSNIMKHTFLKSWNSKI